jgi:FdhE protein
MTPAERALDNLKQRRPEWTRWVVVIEEIVRENASSSWDAAVPGTLPDPATVAPLLADATLTMPMRSVERLWKRLLQIASRTGLPKMAALSSMRHADVDMCGLFAAALCQDGDRLGDIAVRTGTDGEVLQTVAALLPMPFLHACTRRWAAARANNWAESYCPVCGAWPTLVEVRGIERSRYFRCGRCSAEWYARALSCPYCGTNAHDDLASLVPEQQGSNAIVEACNRCQGYVKAFTRLEGCPSGTVMLEDLASVDLDLAALAHGYHRPSGVGRTLEISVRDSGAARRLLSWR